MLKTPPEYGTVGNEAYAELGLKSGLEIHQQLSTSRKLFCNCPVQKYSDDYDAEILRHMRPTLSELGEYDGTALMEFKTRKEIIYRLNRDCVCTYEMDDSPPFEISEQAVDIALEIAMLLRLQLIDELHIARKQYLDGSIPTGFQRTTILGVDGWIEYKDRKIGIRQLGLEEDSCREISDVGHTRTYIADRLGLPLIEMVTEPDMKTPQEVEEVGQLLRWISRATGKVRRGIGAARQDVNVSVEGGTRIEIKGVPRIPMIPELVHYEAYRQRILLDIRDELLCRGLKPGEVKYDRADVMRSISNTKYIPVAESVARREAVWAIRLPKFGGLLETQTQPHTVFLKEFSDRVRVIACLQGHPNLISSDSPSQSLRPGEWDRILKTLKAESDDAVIVVWGSPQDVETALNEIEIRANEALVGIPSETRQAFFDGTNGFERILPGPERMYPDTDLPPKAVTPERVERIRAMLPPRPMERLKRYKSLGLSEDLSWGLIHKGRANLFDAVMEKAPDTNPRMLAYLLVCWMTHLKRAKMNVDLVDAAFLSELFAMGSKGNWSRETIFQCVTHTAEGRKPTPGVMTALTTARTEDRELRKESADLASSLQFRKIDSAARKRCLMGLMMKKHNGSVSGPALGRIVDEVVSGN